jgi:hypothetical protein
MLGILCCVSYAVDPMLWILCCVGVAIEMSVPMESHEVDWATISECVDPMQQVSVDPMQQVSVDPMMIYEILIHYAVETYNHSTPTPHPLHTHQHINTSTHQHINTHSGGGHYSWRR